MFKAKVKEEHIYHEDLKGSVSWKTADESKGEDI